MMKHKSNTGLSFDELKEFLEFKYQQYHQPQFIENDPIQIPHLFQRKEDVEIAGFLSASIAWGQRCTIINNAKKMLAWMDMAPFDFIVNARESDTKIFRSFVHRTFNGEDALYFIRALQHIYRLHGGLERAFSGTDIQTRLVNFRKHFFEQEHPERSEKHISSPLKNSACKRLNMFLRWMVREDEQGVDFGIWKSVPASDLICPLDVHSGNTARYLGLINRKQNNWLAATELTEALRKFDKKDPVKYDFALFGFGIEMKDKA